MKLTLKEVTRQSWASDSSNKDADCRRCSLDTGIHLAEPNVTALGSVTLLTVTSIVLPLGSFSGL